MSITIKKIGNRKYAYEAYRAGSRVVQKYLGPAKDPSVVAHIMAVEKAKVLPAELFKYFWDVEPRKLQLRQHGRFIIERILEFGDLKAMWWLQKRYPTAFIIEVCLTSRRLSQRSRHFWAVWFGEEYAS